MLVDQYRVSRPGTLSAYAEIFGGVDLVMFEQSFVNHYQYLKGSDHRYAFLRFAFFLKNAMVIYALRFREFLQAIALVIVTLNII